MSRVATRELPCNALAVRAARAVSARETEWRVKGAPGLVLRVQPSGAANFYVYYNARVGRLWKLRKLRLGSREVVGLAAAKRRAHELLEKVAQGSDPARDLQDKQKATTFRELAELRLSRDGRISERTKADYRAYYRRDVYPVFGDVPAIDVTSEMVVALLDKVENRAPGLADKVKSSIGSVYKWARKRQSVKHDPTLGLGNRGLNIPRDRVLSDDEIKAVWVGIETGKYTEPMRLLLKLLLFTGQRETEVAGAKVSELHLEDVSRPIWRLPGDSKRRGRIIKGRMKGKQNHIVPLSRAAAGLFARAIKLNGGKQHVFPAVLTCVKAGKEPKLPHIRGDSVVNAMARLRAANALDDVTAHDLRRTMTTWLAEHGVPPHIRKLILAHRPFSNDVTETHYTFATCEAEVRRAHELWAAHIVGVVQGRDAAIHPAFSRATA